MRKPIVLIVGLGEVGRPLFEIVKESGKFEVYGFDINVEKMKGLEQRELPEEVDVLHICYPCFDIEQFIRTTVDYMKKFKPSLTIINSTVQLTTTNIIHSLTQTYIVHSPVLGMHRNKDSMKEDLFFWPKYIGGVNEESTKLARIHFEELGMRTKVLRSPVETELAKLFETTYRAWMIACFQEMHRISRHFKADFNEVISMLEDVHRVLHNKPIHFPGVIGGHCLIPNAELLLKSYDSEFIKLILKSNELRKEEIKDSNVLEEVEKVKRRVEALDKHLAKEMEYELLSRS